MNKKKIIIGVLVGIAVIGGIYLYNKNKKAVDKKNNMANDTKNVSTNTNTETPINKNTSPKYRAKNDVTRKYEYDKKGELYPNDIIGHLWIQKGKVVDFEKVTIKNIDYLKDGNKYYDINNFELEK